MVIMFALQLTSAGLMVVCTSGACPFMPKICCNAHVSTCKHILRNAFASRERTFLWTGKNLCGIWIAEAIRV